MEQDRRDLDDCRLTSCARVGKDPRRLALVPHVRVSLLGAALLACEEALALLLRRLDWFFGEFLLREEMTKERDGKIAGELVVKALQKVLARSGQHKGMNLQAEYDRRRTQKR
jgi:hypothetical protein